MSGLVAVRLKKEFGIPFVVTFHALGRVRRLHHGATDRFPEVRVPIEDWIAAEADRIIAECPQDHADLTGLYPADRERIAVIPRGFDRAELWPMERAAARIRLGLDPGEKILLQLGRLVPRKGIDEAVRALAVLKNRYGVAARLLVVGGNSEAPDPILTPGIGRLMEIARKEGIEDRVVFVGRRGRHALKYYYNAADVFISTPWYEPFGITPVEAMACGTPVIGSKVGGIQSTVVHGVTGYLVPPKDALPVAERIAYLYDHPELFSTFGQQGLHRANQLFTWEAVVEALVRVYEETLSAPEVHARLHPGPDGARQHCSGRGRLRLVESRI
jgi:glycosyltransferase involved in cell wall biosynthesis